MKITMGRFMSRRLFRQLSFAGALAAAVMLSGCDKQTEAVEEQLRPVRYITIENPLALRTRTFTGSSKSAQQSRLSFKVAGTVVKMPVQVGDALKAGDLVARLDPSQYELQLQQSQAALMQSQANARNAESNYERVKGLYENNNASRNDLDSARASAESARAQTRSAQKSQELARLNLSYTQLRVDVDCSIASLAVEINENVNAGSQVAQVNCGQELEVIIEVPESLIADISQNMPVDIRFDAMANKTFKGRVSEVGVSTSETSSTFPVSVRLDNGLNSSELSLRSGLAAEVTFSFVIETGVDRYLVPLASVVNDVQGTFVFIADPAEQQGEAVVRRNSVQLGELTDTGIEILSGLETGDRVITAGVSVVRDGQRVLLP
jgi:membrane fusion protein, multidrug efflux system